jgi:hypothetical protein
LKQVANLSIKPDPEPTGSVVFCHLRLSPETPTAIFFLRFGIFVSPLVRPFSQNARKQGGGPTWRRGKARSSHQGEGRTNYEAQAGDFRPHVLGRYHLVRRNRKQRIGRHVQLHQKAYEQARRVGCDGRLPRIPLRFEISELQHLFPNLRNMRGYRGAVVSETSFFFRQRCLGVSAPALRARPNLRREPVPGDVEQR